MSCDTIIHFDIGGYVIDQCSFSVGKTCNELQMTFMLASPGMSCAISYEWRMDALGFMALNLKIDFNLDLILMLSSESQKDEYFITCCV